MDLTEVLRLWPAGVALQASQLADRIHGGGSDPFDKALGDVWSGGKTFSGTPHTRNLSDALTGIANSREAFGGLTLGVERYDGLRRFFVREHREPVVWPSEFLVGRVRVCPTRYDDEAMNEHFGLREGVWDWTADVDGERLGVGLARMTEDEARAEVEAVVANPASEHNRWLLLGPLRMAAGTLPIEVAERLAMLAELEERPALDVLADKLRMVLDGDPAVRGRLLDILAECALAGAERRVVARERSIAVHGDAVLLVEERLHRAWVRLGGGQPAPASAALHLAVAAIADRAVVLECADLGGTVRVYAVPLALVRGHAEAFGIGGRE